MDRVLEEVRGMVIEQMDLSRETPDEEVARIIRAQIGRYSKQHALPMGRRQQLQRDVFHSLRKLSVLQELIDDRQITEVMVNGMKHIFYEKEGRLYEWDRHFSSMEELSDVIQQIAGMNNRAVNEASPIVDTRLGDGSRVNIVMAPVAVEGASICIRKFPEHPLDMEGLIALEAVAVEVVKYLAVLVQAGYNIFISGGTGSGKTTFLNALSQYIPREERIITIEDSAELQLLDSDNLVRLETRNANTGAVQPVTIRDLIRTSLRMRPDRIIVGECRGAEALDMLQAMNTGADGSLSTGHANSCRDMLSRLETMVLMGMELPVGAIRGQIASGIDILIHLGRLRDRSRKLLEVCEIDGMKDGEIQLNQLYVYEEQGMSDGKLVGSYRHTGHLKHTEKLRAAGLTLEE